MGNKYYKKTNLRSSIHKDWKKDTFILAVAAKESDTTNLTHPFQGMSPLQGSTKS